MIVSGFDLQAFSKGNQSVCCSNPLKEERGYWGGIVGQYQSTPGERATIEVASQNWE